MTEEVFQEARRRDPEGKRPWVMLVDGHEGQLEDIHAAIERHGVEVTLILDFIHVLEYLWKAAWCFFVPGCQEAEARVGARALQILRARPAMWPPACGAVPPYVTSAPRSERGRYLRGLPRYLVKYREMLRYDRYLAEGFPIATGVIEGACRHLVKDRMDTTGARWRPGQSFQLEAPFQKLFLISSHDDPRISVEPWDGTDLARRMLHSVCFEQMPFFEYYRAFKFAFPGLRNGLLENLEEVQSRLLLSGNKSAYRVLHPYPVSLKALFNAMAPFCTN